MLHDTAGIWSWKISNEENMEFYYTFSERDIGEVCALRLILLSDSKFHRHEEEFQQTDGPYDDSTYFYYSVNPPVDE